MQKKPNANLRSKLHNIIKKQTSKNERALTSEEAARLAKLRKMHDELTRGKNVQNRMLQTWLTQSEYAEFESDWLQQLEFRKELKDKPAKIKEYEAQLKKAIFYENKANGAHSRGKLDTALKFRNECEGRCERALELLEEILNENPAYSVWIDRAVTFDADSIPGLSPASMPRVVTSRSLDKQAGDIRIMSKIDIKMAVVERAIANLRRNSVGDAATSNADMAKLRAFLDAAGDED